MPKARGPGTVTVGEDAKAFVADALPDVFDGRDLVYRPRLAPLPATLDKRPDDPHAVLEQTGNSCTGHAVAAMVNAVLTNHPEPVGPPIRVSPYMLYAMARRYDEFEGEADLGSSLRGALKGWYHHGLLPVEDWPALQDGPDLDLDAALAAKASEHPLGAFYRVNALRLDDMQSAVNELYGIAASAAIHEGWQRPTTVERDGRRMQLIQRSPGARPLGGHAFAIVGYNEVGFLVQNSWGTGWAEGGFATLPYDDWLDSAYDAWVARPGVRSLVAAGRGEKLVPDTAGGLSTGRGPDPARLRGHVVNLGNEGRLSTDGQFRSTPAQVDAVFRRMDAWHEHWQAAAEQAGRPAPRRRVVLYAHGGLNSESTGLGIAAKHLNWWLNNEVYPVVFAWETGAMETLVNQFSDAVRGRLPAGGVHFDLGEQADRLAEWVARHPVRWMWAEMKENAERASDPAEVDWSGGPDAGMADLPGGTLTAGRVAASCAGREDVDVHLVGHSAGSIFLSCLLPRLTALGVPVRSTTFLAPAIRADRFAEVALPSLVKHRIRFTSFGLGDARELDDEVGAGDRAIYRKSLLYLVSRGFEPPAPGEGEVPLLGMERFERDHLADLVGQVPHGELVWSPSRSPAAARTDARSHGGLDDDPPTMTSVLLRLLEHEGDPEDVMRYAPHAPLRDPGPPGAGGAEGGDPLLGTLRRAGWRAEEDH